MQKILFCVVGMTLSMVCTASSMVFAYNENGQYTDILGIVGLVEESSWLCRDDPSVLCRCHPSLMKGLVASIDYQKGNNIPLGFVFETREGAQYINLPTDLRSELSNAESGWISALVKKRTTLLIAAEMCGAGGKAIYAKDIYSRKMVEKSGLKW